MTRTRPRRRASTPPAEATRRFKARVARWAARLGVQPARVQLQRMTIKWASCSAAGRLCFSRSLLHTPGAFQEVVIVHELLHLLVPNHGKLFRSLMTAYVPAWEEVGRARLPRLCATIDGRARAVTSR